MGGFGGGKWWLWDSELSAVAVTQPGRLQRGGAALTFLISHETRMLNVFPSADNYGLSKLAVKPPKGRRKKKMP